MRMMLEGDSTEAKDALILPRYLKDASSIVFATLGIQRAICRSLVDLAMTG